MSSGRESSASPPRVVAEDGHRLYDQDSIEASSLDKLNVSAIVQEGHEDVVFDGSYYHNSSKLVDDSFRHLDGRRHNAYADISLSKALPSFTKDEPSVRIMSESEYYKEYGGGAYSSVPTSTYTYSTSAPTTTYTYTTSAPTYSYAMPTTTVYSTSYQPQQLYMPTPTFYGGMTYGAPTTYYGGGYY